LNASVAAGVVLYEIGRRRGGMSTPKRAKAPAVLETEFDETIELDDDEEIGSEDLALEAKLDVVDDVEDNEDDNIDLEALDDDEDVDEEDDEDEGEFLPDDKVEGDEIGAGPEVDQASDAASHTAEHQEPTAPEHEESTTHEHHEESATSEQPEEPGHPHGEHA
jgi:hypothetical protein